MSFLTEALKAIPNVASSPYTFVAFIVLVLAWTLSIFFNRISKRIEVSQAYGKLSDLPEASRPNAFETFVLGLPRTISKEYLENVKLNYLFAGFIATLLFIVVMTVLLIQDVARRREIERLKQANADLGKQIIPKLDDLEEKGAAVHEAVKSQGPILQRTDDFLSRLPKVVEGIAVGPRVAEVSKFEVEWNKGGNGEFAKYPDGRLVIDWMDHNTWNRFRVVDLATKQAPLMVRAGNKVSYRILLRNPRNDSLRAEDKYAIYINRFRNLKDKYTRGPLAIIAVGRLRYPLDEFEGEVPIGLQPAKSEGEASDKPFELYVDTVDDLSESEILINKL
jgi:hypothetical protein